MPSLTEVIDLTILGTAIAGLVISILKIKERKSKSNELNKKES